MNEDEVNRYNVMVTKFIELFKMSIWESFYRPNIDNFGGRYIEDMMEMSEPGMNHIILQIIKFKQ